MEDNNRTIMDFDLEGRKTIMAELIVQLEEEILDLRDVLQSEVPTLLYDVWTSPAEVSKMVVNTSEKYGRMMESLIRMMKDANYGTMAYDVADDLLGR